MANIVQSFDTESIALFCKRNQVKRLAFFGSVLTSRFGPHSDIDVLIEFLPGHTPGLFALSGMELELSGLFGRKVDLRTPAELSRHFREEVLQSAETQYAA